MSVLVEFGIVCAIGIGAVKKQMLSAMNLDMLLMVNSVIYKFVLIFLILDNYARVRSNTVDPIMFTYFNCQGNEASLSSCTSNVVGSAFQYCYNGVVQITCDAGLYQYLIHTELYAYFRALYYW